jgi:hypothetical protein
MMGIDFSGLAAWGIYMIILTLPVIVKSITNLVVWESLISFHN